jgi:succinate dehydrogenase (ubiquinone) membrane anchor subunit
MHGSYHWDLERFLSVATLGLMAAPFAVGAGNSMIDLGLAFVLPAHIHMGLDGIVRDYVPYRKFGALCSTFLLEV